MLRKMFRHLFVKPSDKQWCCIGFKAGYNAAGRRGTAYLVGRDSLGHPEFTLQHRVVDKGKEEHIKCDVSASIITDSRILFCPSCGVNLTRFYADRVDALFRDDLELGILKKYDSFIMTPQD